MIRRIKRNNIDLEKYSRCLAESKNYMIYAEYWYLDALTDMQWDCLVLNNYEAIMPLPYQKKLGVKIISQPIYCQQLGIFYSNELSSNDLKNFIQHFKNNLIRGYHFNEKNDLKFLLNKTDKINQILDFPQDIDKYFATIRKNRKQEIKKGLPQNYVILAQENDASFLNLLEENYTKIHHNLSLSLLKKLVQIIQHKKLGFTINILENEKVVASSFYIKSNNRLIQLCNAKKGDLTFNTNTFIVAYILKNYGHKFEILDFEGSSLKGVNDFNASFRAETKPFSVYKSRIF